MQVSACKSLHSVRQRCSRWLLMYQNRTHMKEFPLTHVFLAGRLGVRRASVTYVLHPLREAGLNHYSRGIITIVDRRRLKVTVCECYLTITEYYNGFLTVS